MLRYTVLLMFLCSAGSAGSADAGSPAVDVLVRIFDIGSADRNVLAQAHGVVAKIYSEAGIRVGFQNAAEKMSDSADVGRIPYGIDLRIEVKAPADSKPRALACAYPFAQSGIRIVVFFDRWKELFKNHRNIGAKVLGHALAHEIGHVLLRTDSHSFQGVMRSYWSQSDMEHMATRDIYLAPADAEQMRRILDTRKMDHANLLSATSRPFPIPGEIE